MNKSNINSNKTTQKKHSKENSKLKNDKKFWLTLKLSYGLGILIWILGIYYFKLYSPSSYIGGALGYTFGIFVIIILPIYLIFFRFMHRFISGEKLVHIIFSALFLGSIIYGITSAYKQEKLYKTSIRGLMMITHKHQSQADTCQNLKAIFYKKLDFLISERMKSKYLASKEERYKNYLLILKIKEINQEFYNAYNSYKNKILIDISNHTTEWDKDLISSFYKGFNRANERVMHMQEIHTSLLELVLSLNKYLDTIGNSIEANGDYLLFRNDENMRYYYNMNQKIEEHLNLIVHKENENTLKINNAIERIEQLQ